MKNDVITKHTVMLQWMCKLALNVKEKKQHILNYLTSIPCTLTSRQEFRANIKFTKKTGTDKPHLLNIVSLYCFSF